MLILNDILVYAVYTCTWIKDLMKVATFARAAKVQCWITSCNVHVQPSDWPLGDKVHVNAYKEIVNFI